MGDTSKPTFMCRNPFESCRTMVSLAEEAKVDSVWTPDHFVGLAHPVCLSNIAQHELLTWSTGQGLWL